MGHQLKPRMDLNVTESRCAQLIGGQDRRGQQINTVLLEMLQAVPHAAGFSLMPSLKHLFWLKEDAQVDRTLQGCSSGMDIEKQIKLLMDLL